MPPMAETISGSILLRLMGISASSADAATLGGTVPVDLEESFSNGTSDGQVDVLFTKTGSLSASSVSFDLEDGTEDQPLHTPAEFDVADLLLVKNTGGQQMTLSGNLLGLSAESLPIPAGGVVLIYLGGVGLSVVSASSDIITLTSLLATTYHVVVLGRSA